jgi:hypothetical protein
MITSKKYLPKYPIYIISKGRWKSRKTSKALEAMGIPYFIAVEPQEYDKYTAVIDEAKVLKLPFSNHGKGSGPARNWCWEHSKANGFKRHWILDDNIRCFFRYQCNQRIQLESGAAFRAAEDFTDRFKNVMLSGFQYTGFCPDKKKYPPFRLNTRLMSCILIDNDCPFKWRAKYNEDVDLSLMVLKAGYCTILFNAFLQEKATTQTMKGGNTEELYGGGTFEKSKMLVDLHPDVVKLVQRYGRWHHDVDMSPFKNNKLEYVDDFEMPTEPNEYGMVLVDNYKQDNQVILDTNKRFTK